MTNNCEKAGIQGYCQRQLGVLGEEAEQVTEDA